MAEYAAFEREKQRVTRRMYLLDPEANPAGLSWASFFLSHALEDETREPRATYRYYGGGTEALRERTGQQVRLLCELGEDVVDRAEAGRMYRVRFEDGEEADAFEEELTYLHTAERERVPA